MRTALMLLACCAALLLPACNRANLKPDLPGAGTVVKPEIVYVDRFVYVAIPASLTDEMPIAEGPLSQCPDVAAQRKKAAAVLNSRMRQIRAIQGTEVRK